MRYNEHIILREILDLFIEYAYFLNTFDDNNKWFS